MIKQRLNLNLTASQYLFVLLMIIFSTYTHGLATDKDQPIQVEADAAELDDTKNVSIYTGDVIVTQGTIKMTGDKMTVYHTEEDELDYMIMEGKHATYRQLPDNSTIYDQAVAYQMEYYEQKDLVILISDACVKQEDSIITGERIEYDTVISRVKAFNKPKQVVPNAAPPKKDKRVVFVIKNKKEGEDPSTTKKPEIPVNLQKDCKIVPEKPAVIQ